MDPHFRSRIYDPYTLLDVTGQPNYFFPHHSVSPSALSAIQRFNESPLSASRFRTTVEADVYSSSQIPGKSARAGESFIEKEVFFSLFLLRTTASRVMTLFPRNKMLGGEEGRAVAAAAGRREQGRAKQRGERKNRSCGSMS
jgi:hypothetical protein